MKAHGLKSRPLRLVFGVALLLEGFLCALVFGLLQTGPVAVLPLFGLVSAGSYLTFPAEPTGLRLVLALLLGATAAALWLSLT